MSNHTQSQAPGKKEQWVHLEVSEQGLMDGMAALGFGPSFMHQMRIGSPETGRGYAVLTDWRKLKEPYEVNWVGSVYDREGNETHRFVVRR